MSPKRIRSAEYLEQQRNKKAGMYKQRREFAIRELGGKCVYCLTGDNLELDHIYKGTKSFPVSRAPSEEKFLDELKKCQLLCHSCHRIKSTIEHQGESCSHSKLTKKDVLEIRSRLDDGETGRNLSKIYGVGPMQISRIKNRKRWAHV